MTAAEERTDPTRVVQRTITRRDLPFVTNSWLRSYERSFCRPGRYQVVDPKLYYGWHHRVLESLIPRSNVIIACDRDDPDRIYGWGCAQFKDNDLLVHYIYAKEQWRGLGLGTSLLRTWLERYKPSAVIATHCTRAWLDFIRHSRKSGLLTVPHVTNPYLAILEIDR